MFRKMRRIKQQLSQAQCEHILLSEGRAVIAFRGTNEYPYAIPINYVYVNGSIYFHCAGAGQKIDEINADPHVCFTVHNEGYLQPGKIGYNISSVVVLGTAQFVDDQATKTNILRKIGLKYFDDAYTSREIVKAAKRAHVVRISIDHMTGKLVNES